MLHKKQNHLNVDSQRKDKTNIVFRMLIFCFALTIPVSQSFAKIDNSTLRFYSKNNILYYDPTGQGNFTTCDHYATMAPSGDQITWIGDSYTVNSKSIIEEKFPGIEIYAESGKHFGQDSTPGGNSGLTILKNLNTSNSLRNYIVFALGTNDNDINTYINDTISTVGEKKLILVTPRTHNGNNYSTVIDQMNSAASSHSNIIIADWAQNGYKDEYYQIDPEKLHPSTNGGYDAWVNVIQETLGTVGPSTDTIGGVTGTNIDYKGDQIWSDAELRAVEANKPFYVSSATKYNIPWQILATIHLRENSLLRSNHSNGQGPYQFYSSEERSNCTSLNGAIFTPGYNSDLNFQKHTDCAAKRLIDVYGLTDTSDTTIKKVFFAYNGKAQLYKDQAVALGYDADSGEGSPYVMNLADPNRNSKTNNNWRQITCDPGYHLEGTRCVSGDGNRIGPANQIHGAFILYSAIGGSTGSNVICVGTKGTLVAGGMTLEQAKAYMDKYRTLADTNSYDWSKNEYEINDTRCPGLYNCVAFSQYFVAVNTTKGHAGHFPSGGNVADYLISTGRATDGGTTPQPYAIFSTFTHTSDSTNGHTGVVLGITENSVIIGEAACHKGSSGIKAREITLKEAQDGGYTYAILNDLTL